MKKLFILLSFALAGAFGALHAATFGTVAAPGLGGTIPGLKGSTAFDLEGGYQPQLAVNVLEFGADTNGVTDARAAFVSALAAVRSGGVLLVPAGTYKISAQLSIAKSDFKILGHGFKATRLYYSGAADIGNIFAVTGDNYEIRGVELDGAGKSGIVLDNNGDNFTVENCYITGGYVDADIDPGATTIISNVKVEKGSTGWHINHNLISGLTFLTGGTRAGAGIHLSDFGWSSSADNIKGEIIGNVFDTIGASGQDAACVHLNLTSGYTSGVRIAENDCTVVAKRGFKLICDGATFENNYIEAANSSVPYGGSVYGSRNIVMGNILKGPFASYGIEVGTTAFEVAGNIITGNTIEFTGTAAAGLPVGVAFNDNTYNSICSGNIVNKSYYPFQAFGKVGNCIFDNLIATNSTSDLLRFVTSGSVSPFNCTVGKLQGARIGGQALNVANGTNIFLTGIPQVTDASDNPLISAVTYASGVTGNRTVSIASDAPWIDWNGNPMNSGSGWTWDECINGTYWVSTGSTANSGTTGLTGASFDANHVGAYSDVTGVLTNGFAEVRSASSSLVFSGSRVQRFCWVVKTPASLSGFPDKYNLFSGLGRAAGTSAIVEGAGFWYTDNTNSGRFVGATHLASVATAVNGPAGAAVTANAYWWQGIEMKTGSCKFFAAPDASGAPGAWVSVGESTSNLPNSSGAGINHFIEKTSGSTGTGSRTFVLEKFGYQP